MRFLNEMVRKDSSLSLKIIELLLKDQIEYISLWIVQSGSSVYNQRKHKQTNSQGELNRRRGR